MSTLAQRLEHIQERITLAAQQVGRDPAEITLIGVSKRKPIEDMATAYTAGLRHFGENRAQEVRDKFPAFSPEGIIRHFIGHLQSNKVKYLPGRVDLIHTIDSTRIADVVNQRFGLAGLQIPVLVEVNISEEASKAGVDSARVTELAEYCAHLDHLDFRGLMTIGPLTDDRQAIRRAFATMRRLADQVAGLVDASAGPALLSMGMSGDFELAIQEGASHIRVGTAIFGARDN